MSRPCSWFRCKDDGEIQLIGMVSATNPLASASIMDMPPLGELCSVHYLELRDHLALYRAGNAARDAGKPLFSVFDPITPVSYVNPNVCACGHAGANHYDANPSHPRGCHACDNEGKKCPKWGPPAPAIPHDSDTLAYGSVCTRTTHHEAHEYSAFDKDRNMVKVRCPGREYDA